MGPLRCPLFKETTIFFYVLVDFSNYEDVVWSGRLKPYSARHLCDPDFNKAFDKVAHEKLLLKLHHYGIRGDTLKWIKDFLDNRKQAVVINGINSEKSQSPLASHRALFSVQSSS